MTDKKLSFSKPVLASDVPSGGRRFKIVATPADCADVAQYLGLPAIAGLAADLAVQPFGKDGIGVTGTLRARVTQTCVVTADDFEADVTGPVEIRYSPDGISPHAEVDIEELLADLDTEDPPDLLIDGRIDLAAIIAEFLALSLDPYPKKPGATLAMPAAEPESSPFAALSALRKTPE